MSKTYSIITFWKKHQFKVIVLMSFLCILVLYIINQKYKLQQGSWSLEYELVHQYDPKRREYVRVKQESKGERECRRVMEKLTGLPFPSQRPQFLTNSITGRQLEIDCCNMDLKLGVEYNGIQHYKFTKGMHKTYQDFQLQQYRDEMKKQMCKDAGFTLITVPYTISIQSIENYLLEELRKLGYI